MSREFVYDGRSFPDPDPNLKVDEVRQHMANYFPELSNAETKESKRPSAADPTVMDEVYEFKRRVGTKGVLSNKETCPKCGARLSRGSEPVTTSGVYGDFRVTWGRYAGVHTIRDTAIVCHSCGQETPLDPNWDK